MIKAIAFDKDGTLLDYDRLWIPVAKAASSSLSFSRGHGEELAERMMQAIGAYDGINGLMCGGTYTEVTDAFNSAVMSVGAEEITLSEAEEAFALGMKMGEIVPACENITELFDGLKKLGIKLAVVTNDTLEFTEKCLKSLGISEYFDIVVCDDGTPSKPDPHHMNELLNIFGVEKAEMLMVGDTQTDMLFAKNSGVKGIGVAKTDADKKTLSEYTDCVLNDISEIIKLVK